MNKLTIGVGLAFIFASCGGETASTKEVNSPEDSPSNEMTAENCMYSFNADSTTVSWTAFKTTEKIGVGGKFDTVNVMGTQNSEDVNGVFNSASFSIPVSSINTANPDRDMKIRKFFFGSLAGSETLEGSLVSLADGKGLVAISMNGISKEVEMDYTVDGEVVQLETTINVGEWNAQAGIDALNTECYELHMAGDGVSKLWPEVKIGIRTVLNKTCE
jgi:hypothetical protein